MNKFKKKPVVIEAFQMTEEHRWDKNSEWPEWLREAWNGDPGEAGSVWPDANTGGKTLMCGTLEGVYCIDQGDWIIQGIKGEIYPCKPDIFEATYDKVEAAESEAN